jgi:hypothetical protein
MGPRAAKNWSSLQYLSNDESSRLGREGEIEGSDMRVMVVPPFPQKSKFMIWVIL